MKQEAGTKVGLTAAYTWQKRLGWALAALAAGILLAGFWNYKAVDGFGRTVIAENLVGNTAKLAGDYGQRGSGFGFLFAWAAGLAATFTACNCVVYTMLPGLACPVNPGRPARSVRGAALRSLGLFTLGMLVVCAAYGAYIGTLGPQGVEALNVRTVRLQQAELTFTGIGIVMLLWGMISLGLWNTFLSAYVPLNIRGFLRKASTQASIMGILSGLFTVGRPYPIFRDLLTYAASAQSPFYGALVMLAQGVGQITVMLLMFFLILLLFGKSLARQAAAKPYRQELFSSIALLAGGAYFVFYWGLAIPFDIGSWGFKLGWYR
ncbi:hypothetical protein [Paenibacillus chitinolyticus]